MDGQRAPDPGQVKYGELPELTRGLRALGSPRHSGAVRRGSVTSRVHSLFFQPLLDARRKAASATSPEECLRAFDAADISRALDRLIERIVAEWPDERAPARRALRTALRERADGFSLALAELRESATRALDADAKSHVSAWRAWTAQLVLTFQAADRSWMAIQSVVEALPIRESR